MKRKNNSTSLNDYNIGLIFESLCKLLTRAIVSDNKNEAKKIKNAIIKGIQKQKNLKEELDLYRAIATAEYSEDVNKSYIKELLAQYKKRVLAENHEINVNKFQVLKEELEKNEIQEAQIIGFCSSSPHVGLYSAIETIVNGLHQEESVRESQKFYDSLRTIQANAIKRNRITLKEALQKLRPKEKVPTKVFKNAIRIFEQRYKDVLSEGIRELLEDYLYYSKTNRFVAATQKRMRDVIVETRMAGKRTQNVEAVAPIIQEMEACYEEIKGLKEGVDEKDLFRVVRDVAHFIDISQEIKKIN